MSTKIKNSKIENLQLPKDKKKKKILMSKANYFDEEISFETLGNIPMVNLDIQDIIKEIIIDNNIDLFEKWNVNIEFHNNHNSFRTLVEKNYFSNSGMGREFFENKDNYIVIDFAWLQMKTINELKDDSENDSVQIESVHNAFVQNLFKHIWLLVASMNVAKHKKMILDNGKFGKTFQSFYIDDKSEFGNLFEELKEDEKWVSKSYPTLNFSSDSFDIVNKYFTSDRIERIKNLMVDVDKLKTRNNKTSKKLRDKIDVVSNNGNKIISDLQTSKKVNEVLENYCLIPIEKKNELIENNLLDDKEVKNIVTKKS
mgnify:FL=1|tara:strand:- start:80 stop:1018 length:939 start_codon:yes stop_codon:yes gene_type:complete